MANWKFITEWKRHIINANNKRKNAKHIPHTYKPGDLVLIHLHGHKYECTKQGPYKVQKYILMVPSL